MSSASCPFLDGLDPEQRVAAAHGAGPLLIVAGPGTGKTRTLTHRIAHLVTARGVEADQILAVTFTRRAREEMRERLAGLLPEHGGAVEVTTFHRLGLTILREQAAAAHLAAAGDDGQVRIADESQRIAVLRDVRDAAGFAGTDPARLLAVCSRGRRVSGSGSGTALADERAAALAGAYRAELHRRGLVDFDDLVTLPVEVLSARPDLVAHYRDRWRWICVDEYQDVDEAQYTLLRLLAPADGNLCAIGDPDQAIYAFRGADVGFFLRFREDFPTAATVTLTRNYRSSPVIVAGALAAVAPATLVPGRALTAANPAVADGAAETITVHAAADEADEAAAVVRAIEVLLGGSSFHARDSGVVRDDGVAGGLSFDDIAVLYRTDAQAKPLVEALHRAGIPFQKRSHDRLGDRPGVRTLLLHLASAPTGPAAWRNVGDTGSDADGVSVEARPDGPSHARRIAPADTASDIPPDSEPDVPSVEAARSPAAATPPEVAEPPEAVGTGVLFTAADGTPVHTPRTPVVEHLRQAAVRAVRAIDAQPPPASAADAGGSPSEGGRSETERVAEIHAAVELLTPLARACGDDLERFRAEVELGAEVDTLDPRADRVSLLTLHAAKGLEFPVVFLVGCEDGLLPLRFPGTHPEDPQRRAAEEAEERRLFFVGVSRAQRHLRISHASRRTRRGRTLDVRPSPFLAALDAAAGPGGAALVERTGTQRRPVRDRQLRLM